MGTGGIGAGCGWCPPSFPRLPSRPYNYDVATVVIKAESAAPLRSASIPGPGFLTPPTPPSLPKPEFRSPRALLLRHQNTPFSTAYTCLDLLGLCNDGLSRDHRVRLLWLIQLLLGSWPRRKNARPSCAVVRPAWTCQDNMGPIRALCLDLAVPIIAHGTSDRRVVSVTRTPNGHQEICERHRKLES